MHSKPRILVLDCETAPIIAYVWGLKDQNVALNQIAKDWHLLSFTAKWYGDPANKVIYMDQRNAKHVEDDRPMLNKLWELLDEADFVITQNGKSFDGPKINARFLLAGMPPPSPYRHLDTYRILKHKAAFTSHKLEYLTDKLCTKYKKLSHKKFPGFSLWSECLKGNKAAWDEMKRYNVHDVLATEELYTKIQAWDSSINFEAFGAPGCSCGSSSFESRGFSYTTTGKFRRYKCKQCGKWSADRQNLLLKGECKRIRKSAGGH